MNQRSRVNPFEIGLWALGAVLIVGGVASLIWAVSRLGGGGPESAGFVATQLIYTVAPGAVTAGLFAVVAALALRAALLVVVRSAASRAQEAPLAETPTTTSSPESIETDATTSQPVGTTARVAPVSFAPPQFRPRSRSHDHAAFKRPSAD